MSNLPADSWEKTGVCPECYKRTISGGHCKNCGCFPIPTIPEKEEQTQENYSHDRSIIPGSIDDILSRY